MMGIRVEHMLYNRKVVIHPTHLEDNGLVRYLFDVTDHYLHLDAHSLEGGREFIVFRGRNTVRIAAEAQGEWTYIRM